MLEHVSPQAQSSPQAVYEVLALHQMAQTFRLELEHRLSFEAHCHWYYQTAAENRQDLAKMRSEPNLRSWLSHFS